MRRLKRILANRPLIWAFELSAGLLIALSLANAAYSAPETPTATTSPGMVLPSPDECQVEPLPMEFFEAYIQDPSGAITPQATAGLPEGTPEALVTNMETVGASTEVTSSIDAVTSAAVTATLDDYLACFNANKFRWMWSLLTTRYLNEYLNGGGLPLKDVDLTWIERPSGPRPAGALVGFNPGDDMAIDAEGRICTTVQLITQMIPDNPSTVIVCFVFERARYRIDQLG